ncbi:type II toxin-antitoxin system HipA family toxin [Agreia sp. PsM10]|uniref:type II toxin-antitoxin system HipA family toxin n=1 Tax=Agreia sp. PsM10 TaxID=3030533 RepID=UPI00263B6741|nr:type II toxin-antitoxin system HipA family toxin [Agreia sp. PsM10]MDN4639395.1 type II toxin-antitoxin system HipA family toxin [Agreia sp. PsM10]
MTQTSASISDRVYVWAWLPDASEPTPVGLLLRRDGTGLSFHYGERYLDRRGAVSLYGPLLPLRDEWFEPTGDLGMPGVLRDGAPDGWGRRVILNRLTGTRGMDADVAQLDELTYLLNSGSNRFGAIDFQASPVEYVPRNEAASLDDLHEAALLVEAGELLPIGLSDALLGGSTIGGARPKALIDDGDQQWIAKFSTSSDLYSVVGAEAASIELARRAGIDVPDSKVMRSLDRDVLLTRRFDRPGGGRRRMVISALTMLGLDETEARYGSYTALVEVFRQFGNQPSAAARDLFQRIAFNIAISNTDDHLRNHAAFWDGRHIDLTPAYDLSPMNRSGETATQAIAYGSSGERGSNFASLLGVCHEYGLAAPAARTIIDGVISAVQDGWDDAADLARLTSIDKGLLWGRQFLNPGTTHGY